MDKKDFKTFRESFAYYDRTGMQEYLEQKALEGWKLLKKEFSSDWEFKRIEPQNLHYTITYLPQFSNEDSFLLSENKNEYLELCSEQGWQFVCTYKNMVIFLSEEESPLPLETDPEVELDSIHKSMLKRCLPKCIVALVISIAMIFILLFTNISSNIYALALAVLSMFPLFSATEFIIYLRWHKKALAAAATGKFSRSDTADKLIVAVVIAAFIATVAIVVVKSVINNAWATILYLTLLGAYFLFLHFIEKLKKKCDKGWKNMVINFVRILLHLAVIAMGSYIFDMFY